MNLDSSSHPTTHEFLTMGDVDSLIQQTHLALLMEHWLGPTTQQPYDPPGHLLLLMQGCVQTQEVESRVCGARSLEPW